MNMGEPATKLPAVDIGEEENAFSIGVSLSPG
jgi:hypothetical protein